MPNFNKMHRYDLLASQDRQCAYCFSPLTIETATLEHVKPRSKGGLDHRSNFKASCHSCNSLKADMSETRFKKKIKRPRVEDRFAFWRAYIDRRLGLKTNRACRNIKRSVGLEA